MLGTRPVEAAEYRALYDHMKRDFPRDERPPYFAVHRSLALGVYSALFFTKDGRDVGYAIATAPDGFGYALLNFFAMLPDARGQGCGSQALGILMERFKDRAMVLEVESPDGARDEAERGTRERRIRFYERAGFRTIPTARARLFGVDMRIMMNTEQPVPSVRQVLHALYLPAFKSARWLRFIDIEDAPPS